MDLAKKNIEIDEDALAHLANVAKRRHTHRAERP